MISLLFLSFYSFLLCEETLLFSVAENKIYSSDFYEQIPYSEWVGLDSLKKEGAFNSFLEKELTYYDALSFGLDAFPENNSKLYDRFNHLLINNTYENLVAFPLIDSLSLSLSKKHIKEEVLAYHLLVGYSGCKLPSSFDRTQEEAFSYISSIKKDFNKTSFSSDSSLVVSSFSSLAKKFSEDPSVKENNGYIGWISWGRVMSSFQQEAFNLPFFSVSNPILTPYGYHLILIINKRPSQYAYYSSSLLESLSKKICLQSIPFDSLRAASSSFDSSLVSSSRLVFNNSAINSLFSVVEKKEGSGSRGNKGAYLDWFKEISSKDVYFIYDKKGYGLGWFLFHLEKTPSTRINVLKTKGDIKFLFRSFLLQERVVLMGKEKGVVSSPFFKKEFLNHKKNILKNEYSSFLIESLPVVDSSLVEKAYSRGVFKGEHLAPKRVVYTEINVSDEETINMIYNQFLSHDSFDLLLETFPGKTNNPVSFTQKDPVVSASFLLLEGEVSSPIKTKKGSFSLIRVEKILKEVPFELKRVYKQIERKLKKEKQDSLKKTLLSSLKEKYNLSGVALP